MSLKNGPSIVRHDCSSPGVGVNLVRRNEGVLIQEKKKRVLPSKPEKISSRSRSVENRETHLPTWPPVMDSPLHFNQVVDDAWSCDRQPWTDTNQDFSITDGHFSSHDEDLRSLLPEAVALDTSKISSSFVTQMFDVFKLFDGEEREEDEDVAGQPSNSSMQSDYEAIWGSSSFHQDPLPPPSSSHDSLFGLDPVICCNPIEVEGRTAPEPKMPIVESAMAASPAGDAFDLLEFVTNSSLPVDDPTFLEYCGEPEAAEQQPEDRMEATLKEHSYSEPASSTINLDDIATATSSGSAVRPRSARPPRAAKQSALNPEDRSHGEVVIRQRASRMKCKTGESKYRRMRDLNNEASRRCRIRRSMTLRSQLQEEEELWEKNKKLKLKLQVLQGQVESQKRKFLQKIAKPTSAAALHRRKH